jgi:DNA-binding CsgD family transcriptional regulator
MTVQRKKSLTASPAASNGVTGHRGITRVGADLSDPEGYGGRTPQMLRIVTAKSVVAQLDTGVDVTLGDVDLQLLRLLAQGLGLDAVARHMNCSERTVSRHIRRLSDRVGVSAPIQAVVWAVRRGLI